MAYKDPEKARLYKRAWETRRYGVSPRKRDPEKLRGMPSRAPGKIRERNRRQYLKNRQKRLEQQREWRRRNPTHTKTWFEEHPGYQRAWKQTHPTQVSATKLASNKRRRALKAGASVNDLTHNQWLEIQTAQGHRCYYCGKRWKGKLTQDHLTPLSQGGAHTLHNVIGACRACNSSKGTNLPPVPVQPLLLTLASAKKKAS